jgi:hypothetical protein
MGSKQGFGPGSGTHLLFYLCGLYGLCGETPDRDWPANSEKNGRYVASAAATMERASSITLSRWAWPLKLSA